MRFKDLFKNKTTNQMEKMAEGHHTRPVSEREVSDKNKSGNIIKQERVEEEVMERKSIMVSRGEILVYEENADPQPAELKSETKEVSKEVKFEEVAEKTPQEARRPSGLKIVTKSSPLLTRDSSKSVSDVLLEDFESSSFAETFNEFMETKRARSLSAPILQNCKKFPLPQKKLIEIYLYLFYNY